jgi:hypothetical protein
MTADVSCQCNGVVGLAFVEMLDKDDNFTPQLCWEVIGKFYTTPKDGNTICCVKCKSMVATRSDWR